MFGMKVFFLVVILVSVTARRDTERSWLRRILDELENDDFQKQNQARQQHLNEDNKDSETEPPASRGSHNNDDEDEDEDQYLELRALSASQKSNTGPVITLQNRAAMNTRLRVLYTDENCTPFITETGRLLTQQTKSVTLPVGAKNVKVIVEKDIFSENWRTVYNGTLTGASQCIRITGVTFASHFKPCK